MPDGISQGSTTSCRNTSRRYVIVPEEAWLDAEPVRAEAVAAGTRQEAGLAVRQPEVADPAVAGDLRPSLLGPPEVHVEGDLAVVKSGVVETARFGWVRDGDDADSDLQLRQSPHVLGRRPDVIRRYSDDGTSPTPTRRIVRPKLLPLVSGDLLAVWLESDWGPLYGRQASSLSVSQEQHYLSRLDKETNTWSTVITGPLPSYPGSTFLTNADLVQFQDTGEILCLFIGQNAMSPGSADPRRLYVFGSTDDGATWVEKRRLYFDGTPADILLDSDGDGTADDDTPFQGLAVELLPSGRVVVLAATESHTWSLYSDDRGFSFTPVHVDAQVSNVDFAGHGVSSTTARNDVAVFVCAYRGVTTTISQQTIRMTTNGVDWTEAAVALPIESVDVAICVSPDGWPHLYGTCHKAYDPDLAATHYRDWLWGKRFRVRDPIPGSAQSVLLPTDTTGVRPRGFHAHESVSSAGDYSRDSTPYHQVVYGGWVGIDAVHWRGQVVIAATAQRDAAGGDLDTQPALHESSLVIHRANHWQPLQEILSDARLVTGHYPSAGRVYNRTWDCYGLPGSWNWAAAGAGTEAIIAGGAEGGYLRLDDAKSYNDAGLPSPQASQSGVVRAVVYPHTGGSMTADEIAIRLFLNSSTSTATAVVVRFENTGTAHRVGLFNYATGAAIGAFHDFALGSWIEVLLRTRSGGTAGKWDVLLYAREYVRASDPDWDAPYVLVASSSGVTAYAVATDALAWGQFGAGAGQASLWKTVQLHRTTETLSAEVDLQQRGTTWIDVDSENDKATTGSGEPALDSGVDNVMRAAVCCVEPPQFLCRGISVGWRGEASTRGLYSHASGYDYDASRALDVPIGREWRSEITGDEMELVFDADPTGTTGARFRPDGLAVFGRNFPALDLRMNDTDGPWDGTAPFIRVFGYQGSALAENRYTHVWANPLPFLTPYHIEGVRLSVYPTTGDGPWRPHQYRSLASGPRFYLAVRNSNAGETYVYRIRDNTEDTLILYTEPAATDCGAVSGDTITWPYGFVIFSSTFAGSLIPGYPEDFTPAGSSTALANSHVKGYRYLRLLLPRVHHMDADEAFYRLGCVMLGKTIDLGSPDVLWGWRRDTSSGASVQAGQDGSARSTRNHSPRRSIAFDTGYMRPPAEMASGLVASPLNAMPVARRSWAHWVDAVRRLEVDDTPCALIWEGDRFYGVPGDDDQVPVVGDPADAFAARVTSPGTVEHVQWENAALNIATGSTTLPRPAMRISGIVFTEEF